MTEFTSETSATAIKGRWVFLRRLPIPLTFGSAIILFSCSTALHFLQIGSFAEFFIAIIAIVPLASVIRYKTRALVLELQSCNYELLAGALNGILGYVYHFQSQLS